MDQAIAKKWVAALRSGKYKQGHGQLRKDNRFCCLGVLCDLAPISAGSWRRKAATGDYLYDWNTGGLTIKVLEWASMSTLYPAGFIDSTCDTLMHLNDSGKTFVEIADIIERHWEEL